MTFKVFASIFFSSIIAFQIASCESNDASNPENKESDSSIVATENGSIAADSSSPRASLDTVPIQAVNDSIVFAHYKISEETEVTALGFRGKKYSARIARKEWNNIYNSCRLGSVDYNIGDFDFLGVGNPKGIGSVIDKNTLLSRLPLDTFIFSQSELKQIVSWKNYTCDIESTKALVLDAIFNGTLQLDGIDSALAAVIKTSFTSKKDVSFNAKTWKKCEINTGLLSYILKTGSNLDKKLLYRNQLVTKGGALIAKAIYIESFSLDLGLASKLSVELQNKLKSNPAIKVGDLALKIGLVTSSDKVVHVSATSPFIVYGYLVDGKNIPL